MKNKKILVPFLASLVVIPISMQKMEKQEFTTERINYSAASEGIVDANLYKCITEDDEYSKGLSGITNLSCYTKGVQTLEGINQLTNLTELNVGDNKLTSIDLSGNTKLRWLEASYNQLTSIKLPQSMQSVVLNHNKLTNLDLHENTNLISVEAENNNLTSLNVANIKSLSRLEIENNNLETLVVSGTSLAYISVVPPTNLKKLYASSMENLQSLYLGNFTNLDDIDTSFSKFEMSSSFENLTKLQRISASVDKIKTIDFSLYPNLTNVVTTKTDTISVKGTSITTDKLLEYVPKTIDQTNGVEWYLNGMDESNLYTKNTFSGKSDQDLYPILVIKGNNSDIKGFSGTQEYRAFYRLKFTNDTNKDETKTTSSHKIGIKEIGLIGIVLIGISLLVIFIKTKKNNMNS